jgi:hypothetical protein
MQSNGETPPEAIADRSYSGKFMVRDAGGTPSARHRRGRAARLAQPPRGKPSHREVINSGTTNDQFRATVGIYDRVGQTGSMEYGGVVPTDAPDPSIESEARVLSLPFPVFQLRPQPSLTRAPLASFTESNGSAGQKELSVSFTYTLWKYPDDRSDPRNEIELDERTRRAIEEEPPWGRPTWLIEQAQIFRYPMLSDAIRTAWHASPERERASLPQQLVDHTNHVLRNSFREELGLPAGPSTRNDWKVTTTAVVEASANVDGCDRPAVQIDTDPFVYAIGFRAAEQVVCTSVLSRESLPFLDFALTTYE